MRTGCCAKGINRVNRAGHRSRKTDAKIGAEDVVVHCLRDRNDLYALLVETAGIAQRIISSNGDNRV